MTRVIFTILLCGIAIPLETVPASFGILIPFFSYVLFYLPGAFPFRHSFFAAFIGGAVLDCMSGFSVPYSVPAFLLIVFAGYLWAKKLPSGSIFLYILPGQLIPFIRYVPLTLFYNGIAGIPALLPALLVSAVFSAVTLPLWMFLFHVPVKFGNLSDNPEDEESEKEELHS